MKKDNRVLVFILLFVFVCTFLIGLCGCFIKDDEVYTDDTGVYTIHATYASLHYLNGNGSEEPATYTIPPYVTYNSRRYKIKDVYYDKDVTSYKSFVQNGNINRLVIPSTVERMNLGGYIDLKDLTDIDMSDNKHFVMEGGALYSKNKTQLVFCLYNYTGALKIFRRTTSIFDKDKNFIHGEIFDGQHMFENVEVERGNPLCCSVDGALYSKNKSKMLYYSPYKKDAAHTFPEEFNMVNVKEVLSANKYLKSVYVEKGNEHYKSVDGVLYSLDGTKTAYYPLNRKETTFNLPAELTSFMRTDSFMMQDTLQSITVAAGNQSYKSVNGVLYTANGSKLVCYPLAREGAHFAIPSTVRTIGDYAFHNARNLQTLFIPISVERLDSYSITGNIEYFVEGEQSELYQRLEAYGAAVHYGVTLQQYLETVEAWGD